MTQDIFTDWFISYFVLFVEKPNKENYLHNKALLILVNAPFYPIKLKNVFHRGSLVYDSCNLRHFMVMTQNIRKIKKTLKHASVIHCLTS